MSKEPHDPTPCGDSEWGSTHWSLVLEAAQISSPDSRQAMEALCQTYWYPAYAFVRRRGYDMHEAQDLTQEFFAQLLEKGSLGTADPSRGRFRSFLLACLRNFLTNEWKKTKTQKRGGRATTIPIDALAGESRYALEPMHELTPERLYEREWASTLLDIVVVRLRDEYIQNGKQPHFDALKSFISGSSDVSYAQVARQLGMSEGAAMTAAHRLRKRFAQRLRAEIAQTVATPAEIEDEVHQLLASLG